MRALLTGVVAIVRRLRFQPDRTDLEIYPTVPGPLNWNPRPGTWSGGLFLQVEFPFTQQFHESGIRIGLGSLGADKFQGPVPRPVMFEHAIGGDDHAAAANAGAAMNVDGFAALPFGIDNAHHLL